jgi:hypothetical protein
MNTAAWTNQSAKLLARDKDPIDVITDRARALTLRMMEEGWPGPPFDPLWIVQKLGVEAIPVADTPDARTVPSSDSKLRVRIEYNPSRPTSRRRFSIAHEVGHLLFEDVAEATRNRSRVDRAQSDDWQLELLCNIAAAEIAMPVGSLEGIRGEDISMHEVIDLRARLDVSFEALLLRITRTTDEPVALAVTSRESPTEAVPFRLDYATPSKSWNLALPRRGRIPSDGLHDCTAISYTSGSARVLWPGLASSVRMECVGVPPYPGHRWPRVIALLFSASTNRAEDRLRFVYGDATQPVGAPPRIIAHIVNDRARAWSGGFAAALGTRLPSARHDFAAQQTQHLAALGTNVLTAVDGETLIVNMVAQAGYGPSKNPRIRYAALESCLSALGLEAAARGASVHMPRIGTGQARGRWSVIRGLIDEQLVARGCSVTVYDPPGQAERPSQSELDF